ncbi:MAG: hypothetical protein CMJ46_14385 [Planctomyces sp.]|nr:hypothetical protein [Planctomyces sp.]
MPASHSLIPSRRDFLKQGTLAAAAGFLLPSSLLSAAQPQGDKPLRVAAICTVMFHRSHAHVILENFLQDYLFNGQRVSPGVEVVSIYFDQRQPGDIVDQVLEQYPIPLYKTIGEALCAGGNELAVDAVLNIGEHGNYAYNHLEQHMYPRKRFFDEAVAEMKRANRFVPVFNDKHLSYSWDEAKEMYDTAQQYGIPLMAGSSVPLAQRRPPLELAPGSEIKEAVSIHLGGVESYDFHALEVLQSMVENRQGGETGISKVEFLDGDGIMKAAEEGRFDWSLAETAIQAELQFKPGVTASKPSHGILLTYKDGMKATILSIKEIEWGFACRMGNDEVKATSFYVGPWNNRNLFKALSHAIQTHFKEGEAPYPVERTLLTSGVLDALMHSRKEGKPVETPELEFSYKAKDYRAMREMGATWKIINEGMPEPELIVPHGL